MKILFSLWLFIALLSCDNFRGGFPEVVSTQPTQGCNQDVRVSYKNNCSKNIVMYFIDVIPGTTINCESLIDNGNIAINESKTVAIHKGKIGYFVFAEDSEGKCTGGHRVAESWLNCEQATEEAIFFVCQ